MQIAMSMRNEKQSRLPCVAACQLLRVKQECFLCFSKRKRAVLVLELVGCKHSTISVWYGNASTLQTYKPQADTGLQQTQPICGPHL